MCLGLGHEWDGDDHPTSDERDDLKDLLASMGGTLITLELYNCIPSLLPACASLTNLEHLYFFCEDYEEDGEEDVEFLENFM